MNKYKGLFTFDEDNHRYVPIAQADGIIDTMDYEPDSKPAEPLIKYEKIRKAVRVWAEANEIETVNYDSYWVSFRRDDKSISFKDEDKCLGLYGLGNDKVYTITELCGEEEE